MVNRLNHFVIVVVGEGNRLALSVYICVQFRRHSLHHINLACIHRHFLLQIDVHFNNFILQDIKPRLSWWLTQISRCLAHLAIRLQLLDPLKCLSQLTIFLTRSSIKRSHPFLKRNQ